MDIDSIFPFIALLLLLLIALTFGYTSWNNHYWSKGKIPPNFKNTPLNQMEICVAFGGLFARFDRQVLSEKYDLLQRFTRKHFPNDHYDYRSSFKESVRNPTEIEEIAKWFVKNRVKKEFLKELGQLGFNLVISDGFLTATEDKQLATFFYHIKEETYYSELKSNYFKSQQKRTEGGNTQSTRPSKNRLYYAKILGISENAGDEEIKTAFRKLAKKYHPDRQKTEADKNESTRLFQEVVEAKDWMLAN